MDIHPPQSQYRPQGVRGMTYWFIFLGALALIICWIILFMRPEPGRFPMTDFIIYSPVPLPAWIVELILWRSVSAFFFLLAWGFWTMKTWAYWITAFLVVVQFLRVLVLSVTNLMIEVPADLLDFLSSTIGLVLPGYFVWEVLRRSTRDAFFNKQRPMP